MIAILGKGFISCLKSSNNRNLQLLSFQKIYILYWGFYETCDRETATTRGCHLGYTDTLKLKLRVFLADHSVAMVTYYVTTIIPTCSNYKFKKILCMGFENLRWL